MNMYIIVDTDTCETIRDFFAENEDDAITYVFSLYNPPPANYGLYYIGIVGNGNDIIFDEAKIVWLPDEITEDGDYFFDGSIRSENKR